MLTDAVYFKGGWTDVFNSHLTRPHTFFGPDGKSATTPMMEQQGRYSYLEASDFQGIRLRYGNGNFAMYVFLPHAKDGLRSLINPDPKINQAARWLATR